MTFRSREEFEQYINIAMPAYIQRHFNQHQHQQQHQYHWPQPNASYPGFAPLYQPLPSVHIYYPPTQALHPTQRHAPPPDAPRLAPNTPLSPAPNTPPPRHPRLGRFKTMGHKLANSLNRSIGQKRRREREAEEKEKAKQARAAAQEVIVISDSPSPDLAPATIQAPPHSSDRASSDGRPAETTVGAERNNHDDQPLNHPRDPSGSSEGSGEASANTAKPKKKRKKMAAALGRLLQRARSPFGYRDEVGQVSQQAARGREGGIDEELVLAETELLRVLCKKCGMGVEGDCECLKQASI